LVSGRTRTRLQGLKELGITAARQNPSVNAVMTGKETSDSLYKVVKGKKPPSYKELLEDAPALWEKREAKRERAFDRRFGK